jgi:hypothetical protein
MDAAAPPRRARRVTRWTYLLLFLGTSLLTLATVGAWVETVLLDQEQFVALTTGTLRAEDSRDAIARELVNVIEQNTRQLPAAVREPLEAAIAGLLKISLIRTALELASTSLWQALFVDHGAIILDVIPLHGFINQLIDFVDPTLRALLGAGGLPTEITLVEQGQLPDLEPYKNFTLMGTFISTISGLALLIFVFIRYFRVRPQLYQLLQATGLLFIAQGLFLVIIPWLAEGLLVDTVPGPTGQTLTREAYGRIIAELNEELVGHFVLGIILLGIGYLLARRWARPAPLPEPAPEPAPSAGG